ncbi:MAG TPA: YihY/virulence factor BrkB family protein [Nitrospirae bacterium]|nr:YihY/virulence factor BrkB family protein [Nitrospirota bacterium]
MKRVRDFFVKDIWETDVRTLGRFRAFLVRTLRILHVAVLEFSEGQLVLRAMSLVYTTLLSLVPLLAVSFSVLKAFGVHNLVEPLLYNFLAPLGPKGEELTQRIIGFVENMKVGVLGSLGLAMLIYTVISMIQKIEDAFNYIWRIRRPRSFVRRFSDYMSVLLIGPVLIFTAIGITASIRSTTIMQRLLSVEPFGTAVYIAGKVLPYVFVCAAFTFVYIFVPNTKVRFKSALVGGLFAGVLWETTGWVFASFVVSSTKYAAIYSGFAILIIFMIWLYLSWLILLVGAEVSFHHQYPQFLTVRKEALVLSNRLKEKLALMVMFLIGYNHYYGRPPWSLDSLIEYLSLPVEPVQDVITLLCERGFVVETADDPVTYLPARDIERIRLKDLLCSVRAAEEGASLVDKRFHSVAEVDRVMNRIDGAIEAALGGDTIEDIVLASAGGDEPQETALHSTVIRSKTAAE